MVIYPAEVPFSADELSRQLFLIKLNSREQGREAQPY